MVGSSRGLRFAYPNLRSVLANMLALVFRPVLKHPNYLYFITIFFVEYSNELHYTERVLHGRRRVCQMQLEVQNTIVPPEDKNDQKHLKA